MLLYKCYYNGVMTAHFGLSWWKYKCGENNVQLSSSSECTAEIGDISLSLSWDWDFLYQSGVSVWCLEPGDGGEIFSLLLELPIISLCRGEAVVPWDGAGRASDQAGDCWTPVSPPATSAESEALWSDRQAGRQPDLSSTPLIQGRLLSYRYRVIKSNQT